MPEPFTEQVIEVIRSIPAGRVLSYGRVAALAGDSRGARQVVRILHSSSGKYDLPWHRVVNARGEIAIGNPRAAAEQRRLLEEEGVVFGENGRITMKRFMWSGRGV